MQRYNEPQWISLDAFRHTVFNTLLTFLREAARDSRPEHNPDSTLITIASLGNDNPTADDYPFHDQVLFAIILTIVKQTPGSARQQDDLLGLVLKIRSIGLPVGVSQQHMYSPALDYDMNQDLTQLMVVFTDFERDAPLHPPLERRYPIGSRAEHQPPWRHDTLTPAEWTNLNAFMAKLHHEALDILKLDLRGMFAMIEALEQPLTPAQLEDALPAAAAWITYAGPELKSNSVQHPLGADNGGAKRVPSSAGELWTGPPLFSKARWRFWMERFKEIADKTDVSETVKKAALGAFENGQAIRP